MRHHRGGFGGPWWVGSTTGWRIGNGQRRLRVASATLFFCKPPGLSPTSDARLIGCTSSTSGSGLRSPWSGRPLQAMRKESWDSVFSWIRPFQPVAVRSPDNCSRSAPYATSPASRFSPFCFLDNHTPFARFWHSRHSLSFYTCTLLASCLRIDHAPSRRPCFPVGLKGVAPP